LAFDARQPKRWEIPKRALLKESEAWFGTSSVWQAYPRAMTGITLGVLIQSILINGFLLNHIRRKRVEAALKQSENRYRQVVESQRDMVCRYKEDATLTFVNDAYCEFFGKSREELIGRSFFTLIPADRHEEVQALLRDMLHEKQTRVLEHQVVRPDGSIGWMQWEDYPILGDGGEILELQGIGRDITKGREALDALSQSEERFSGIFRSSPAAMSIVRQSDGRLVEVNSSWENFFGISRSKAINATLLDIGLLNTPKSEKRFRMFLNSGKSLEGFEQKVVTPRGEIRWMNVSCELVTLNGEACYIVMSKDITGQKEAEDARHSLAKATKLAMLGELTASIAHEVNQPLGAILSNADTADILLRLEDPPIAEVLQILSDIRRDDLRASEIIKRVRGMVSKHEMRRAEIDLNEVLKDVEELISHDIHRNGIKIVRELAADLPVVHADRIQIEQVMMNLVLNAIDALSSVPPNLRWIVIRSSFGLADSVEASVEDSGPGIKEDSLPRIFDSFFTTKDSGMGLGLALSRSIAEAHGGGLAAENNSHGGATLRLILPISRRRP
jgi:PAS domain S-box-containing protein